MPPLQSFPFPETVHGLSTPCSCSCCCCCSLRLLFNGLMPKNDDEDDEANDGCQPHRIQLFGHCVFLLHVFCICICVGPSASPSIPGSLHVSVSLSARRPGGWWWVETVRTLEFNLISVLRSPASQKLLHLTRAAWDGWDRGQTHLPVSAKAYCIISQFSI